MRLNSFLKKVDKWHLELLGILVIAVIMFPIVYLIARDGNGSAIFRVHDQLDETILNYVFPARYGNAKAFEQMMCCIPKEGLKPFSILFVPLYKLFDVYTAFELQYFIVIVSSFFSMYFCVRKLTGSSISALIAATMFSFLPVHSIYGNVVMGTPLLVLSVIHCNEEKKSSKIVGALCAVFYALTSSLTLSGWAALGLVFVVCVYQSVRDKKIKTNTLLSFSALLITYICTNIDLLVQIFSSESFVSHRTEFVVAPEKGMFMKTFLGLLTNGSYTIEAESKHLFVLIPVIAAIVILTVFKASRKYSKLFLAVIGAILITAFLSGVFSTKVFVDIKSHLPGMLYTFQFTRVYYFLPGAFYILLGISSAIILNGIPEKVSTISWGILIILNVPLFLSLAKDPEGIFYQNINQINYGQSVTGYVTMKRLYAEDLMQEIEDSIGKDMSTYRIVHIGISPVASLMHGFYTIDGYSNNYPLEYKHQFREVISGELEKNDYIKEYYDSWGSRCYAFYHEWGNAYMLGTGFDGTINDLNLNFSKMKEMNCQYIFSAGEIIDCEQYDLSFVGEFNDKDAYWNIRVYELQQ